MWPYTCIATRSKDSPYHVSELICTATKTLDKVKMEKCMLPMDMEVACQILISHVVQPNFLSWYHEKPEGFTVRSPYHDHGHQAS
jgi:hypothetical protein